MNLSIRWMIRRDMPEVLEIEAASCEFPWGDEEFVRCLRERNCIGMVATPFDDDDQLLGYILYEIQPTRLELLNFAVHPDHRRQGVGRYLIAKMIAKLTHRRRKMIETYVRESNLPALKFFRAIGFRAAGIVPGYYNLTTDDAYRLRFQEGFALTDDDLDRLFHGA